MFCRLTFGSNFLLLLSLMQLEYRIWLVLVTMSKTIVVEGRKIQVEPLGRGFIPGGQPLLMGMTLEGNVEFPCTTGFTCQTMEMQFGGKETHHVHTTVVVLKHYSSTFVAKFEIFKI